MKVFFKDLTTASKKKIKRHQRLSTSFQEDLCYQEESESKKLKRKTYHDKRIISFTSPITETFSDQYYNKDSEKNFIKENLEKPL